METARGRIAEISTQESRGRRGYTAYTNYIRLSGKQHYFKLPSSIMLLSRDKLESARKAEVQYVKKPHFRENPEKRQEVIISSREGTPLDKSMWSDKYYKAYGLVLDGKPVFSPASISVMNGFLGVILIGFGIMMPFAGRLIRKYYEEDQKEKQEAFLNRLRGNE
jgi:hypothetical protein